MNAQFNTIERTKQIDKKEVPRRLELVEWETLDVNLSSTEISDLLRCPAKVLHIQTLSGGMCRLRPGPVVGRLQLGTVDLKILPKYSMPSLLAMLAEVHELVHLTPDLVGYDTNREIVDLLVQIFLSQVEGVVRQGLKRAYIQEDEELVTVRGRIDLRRTVDLHLRGKAKVQCRYEDYTLDGPENRILLAALHAITGTGLFTVLRRNLAHLLAAEFVGVRHIHPPVVRSGKVEYDRLNQYYYPAVQLAQLIMRSIGITQDFGMTEADGFLLDMNQLFEKYVFRKLQKALGVNRTQVRKQQTFPFDLANQASIKPDLIIQSQQGRRIVADTKYKIGNKPDPNDLYQMLAYCRVLNISNGVLITVGNGKSRRYEVRDSATTIDVISIDLSGSIAGVDASTRELADSISKLLNVECSPVSK